MLRGQLEIEIEAPLEVVFDILTDLTKIHTWNPSVIEASLFEEEAVEKGSKGKFISKSGGMRMEYEFICSEYDRPKLFSFVVTGSSETTNISYELTPTEIGTRISYRFEVKFKGIWSFLEPLIKLFKRLFIKQERRELEALKDYITKNK